MALRFLLDHAQDLTDRPAPAQDVAQALIARSLRRSLASPAPATPDRRIASWQAFHRMRNLPSPFTAPLVQQARQKARRALAKPRVPKSPRTVTREILETLLASGDASHRGIRDRALLMLAFASDGRRRAEVTALTVEDIGREDFDATGLLWLRLLKQDHAAGAGATPAAERPRRPRPDAQARGHGNNRRAFVPPGVDLRSPPAPPSRARCAAGNPAASLAAGGLARRLRDPARAAVRISDPSCPRGCPSGRRHAAQHASLRRSGAALLCRCRDRREPGDRSTGRVRALQHYPRGADFRH